MVAVSQVTSVNAKMCDQHGSDEPKMKVISLKPQGDQGYNAIGGDKKEILNALMNRYKSL